MLDDPIVEEVRKVRQEYAAKFDYDLRSIFLDIKRQEVEYRKKGWKVISCLPIFLWRGSCKCESPKAHYYFLITGLIYQAF